MDLMTPVMTQDELHDWIVRFTGLVVPRENVCPHHHAPFEYLRSSYFEPSVDQIIWAPRGGGKTSLAAVATLLDLLHKPGITVRILGGSLDQSLKMWESLLGFIHDPRIGPEILSDPRAVARRLRLRNGSSAAVLTQSQRSVRGVRVQKIRCDEVELFERSIWSAAQLTTRSIQIGDRRVHGSIEAISTLHKPYGLMRELVDQSASSGMKVTRWCLLDVLERCPPERDCQTCALYPECRGIAKLKCEGFFSIDDAIRMKQRVSESVWQAEMLCQRPSQEGQVFPMLNTSVHCRTECPFEITRDCEWWLGIDFGFSAPLVCLWIIRKGDQAYVVDEHVGRQMTLFEHLVVIESRPWRVRRVACDPAGATRNEQTARSNIDFLRARGYSVKTRASRIVDGVELIRSALKSAAGQIRLFIHPRCQHLIRALEEYRYRDPTSEIPMKDGVHDHAVDALRYFYINTQTMSLVRKIY